MAGNSALEQKLRAGIEAARKGDKPTAQKLLRQVTAEDDRNEIAWMWLASVSESLQERRNCLEMALRINPKNARAQEALNQLSGLLPPRPGESSARRPGAPGAGRVNLRGRRSEIPVGYTIAGVLVLLALVTAIIFSAVSNAQPPTPNAATRAALSSSLLTTPTITPTIDPADYTATPFYGVIVTAGNLPTLPPSFTPTFTPTATATPFPTLTPFPVSLFTLVFTSQTGSDAQPGLFTSAGDGTNTTQIGAGSDGFMDPAYDPTGQNVAFIRIVTYVSDDGGEVTAPELFIAPVNDLDAARQVTKFGGDYMAHPTFGPNGIEIVLVSNISGNDDLWYLTEDGNNVHPLTTDLGVDKDPAWSPNGDVILFASERAGQAGSGLTEIFSITPDGETVEQLTDAAGSSFNPVWSPTGEKVVFISDRNGDGDIYTMDPDGQLPFLLTVDDGQAEDRSPAFTPNGRSVVFLSERENETFALYMVDLDGRNPTRLGDTPANIESLTFLPVPLGSVP